MWKKVSDWFKSIFKKKDYLTDDKGEYITDDKGERITWDVEK